MNRKRTLFWGLLALGGLCAIAAVYFHAREHPFGPPDRPAFLSSAAYFGSDEEEWLIRPPLMLMGQEEGSTRAYSLHMPYAQAVQAARHDLPSMLLQTGSEYQYWSDPCKMAIFEQLEPHGARRVLCIISDMKLATAQDRLQTLVVPIPSREDVCVLDWRRSY